MIDLFEKLVKKEYTINVVGKDVKFKQLSFYECMEYATYSMQEDFNIFEWLNKLFGEELNYKRVNLKELMIKLYDTAFKGFYKKGDNKEYSKNQLLKMQYDYTAYIIGLCEKISIDPLQLFKTYTCEQLEVFSDGFIYKLNEESKIGKGRNKIMIDKKSTDDSERQKILDMVNKLDNK